MPSQHFILQGTDRYFLREVKGLDNFFSPPSPRQKKKIENEISALVQRLILTVEKTLLTR